MELILYSFIPVSMGFIVGLCLGYRWGKKRRDES